MFLVVAAVAFGEVDLLEEKSLANGTREEPSLLEVRERRERVWSSQPWPLAEEMVPAHRQEKGIRQRTQGTTRDSAPWKVYWDGTNCMIRKKTGGC
jgi:hypothetical protein